jgi:large subunit ribosomal protein L3
MVCVSKMQGDIRGMSTEKLFPEGLIGRKLGMTQVFTEDGRCIPVTALEVGPCYVLSVRDAEKDGYSAVQLGFDPKKSQRVNKPEQGHFAKAGKGAFYHVKEVRCDAAGLGWNEPGHELKVGDVFSSGEFVDVCGVSRGRGFQGVVKRFGVKGQPATRGTHEVRRNIGSIGAGTYPGKVWKNQKMPGRLGGKNTTVQNLKVVDVKPEKNVILVKGAIPGAKGGLVFVKKAMKKYAKAAA